MRDTSMLEQRVIENMRNRCFDTIVCEAFLGAVPINAEDLTPDLKRDILGYATECLQDAGEYAILERALANTSRQKNPLGYAYLKEIQSVCMEAATMVGQRVAEEFKDCTDSKAIEEAAKKASMTPQEYSKFSKGASKAADEKLSEMIKKKVLDTVKNEKEAYQRDADLEAEIKEAIADVAPDSGEEVGDSKVAPVETSAPVSESFIGRLGARLSKKPLADLLKKYNVTVEENGDNLGGLVVEIGDEADEKACKNIRDICTGFAKRSKATIQDDPAGNPKKFFIAPDEPTEQTATESDRLYDMYMRNACGPNYRAKHQSVFSRLQELAYESVLYTTEDYHELPMKTASLVTRRNTFPIFGSADVHNPMQALESVCRLATETLATPDSPENPLDTKNANEVALMTAAIIYTFFETLNTMHLYCPGLDEVRKFVDQTVPMSSMVESDKTAFMNQLTGIITSAMNGVKKAVALPELDDAEKQMDIVREACTKSPNMKDVATAVESRLAPVYQAINAKRQIIREKANVAPAVESQMDIMHRERDTMKFDRTASSYGRRHDVHSIRFKISPRANSGIGDAKRYVAMECLDAGQRIVSKATVVLEGAVESDTLPKYVERVIRDSKLISLDKPISVFDSMNGKMYAEILPVTPA